MPAPRTSWNAGLSGNHPPGGEPLGVDSSASLPLLFGALALAGTTPWVLRRRQGPTRPDAAVLLGALALRDERAARHAAAVGDLARAVAATAGMGPEEVELAQAAGRVHDIGRLALADRTIDLSGAPSEEDWRAIRRHPRLGADLVAEVVGPGVLSAVVVAHHERLDGRGYPRGLTAAEIPDLAKVVAVAEVYDVLTARDSYRGAMTSRQALAELRRVVGTQLDGRYVEALGHVVADLVAASPMPNRERRPRRLARSQ